MEVGLLPIQPQALPLVSQGAVLLRAATLLLAGPLSGDRRELWSLDPTPPSVLQF